MINLNLLPLRLLAAIPPKVAKPLYIAYVLFCFVMGYRSEGIYFGLLLSGLAVVIMPFVYKRTRKLLENMKNG